MTTVGPPPWAIRILDRDGLPDLRLANYAGASIAPLKTVGNCIRLSFRADM